MHQRFAANMLIKCLASRFSQHTDVHFDGWELKKSILNTIFQAVKAITGGIAAINGQLIKGSGYAISKGGQVYI